MYEQNPTLRAPTQEMAISRFMSRTYGWMFAGLSLTALTSFAVATNESLREMVLMNRGIMITVLILQVALVLGMSFMINKISAAVATLFFMAYSISVGISTSMLFFIYTTSSLGGVFLVTAGMFGGLALFGTVTKRDLGPIGNFMIMGLFGVILIGLINLFVHSAALDSGLALASVVIFSGLTAYDAQKIRALAYQFGGAGGMASEAEAKGAIFGALVLYLDFINLFYSLIRLFGQRRD